MMGTWKLDEVWIAQIYAFGIERHLGILLLKK